MEAPTIKTLAERRFTIAARILTDSEVTVKICDLPTAGACAWWQHDTKQVFLNDAAPRESEPVRNLIFNRGKLFHELGHKLFTNAYDYRNELERKAKSRALFDRVRQTLEDGYIEYMIGKRWEGATPYIRSLLGHILKSDKTEFGALALFVREPVWRDDEAKAFWQRWESLITKAIHTDSKAVCDAAFEISEALAKEHEEKQRQPEPPQGEGKGKSGSEQSDEGEESEGGEEQGEGEEQDEGEGEATSDEGEESEGGEEQDEGEGEEQDEGAQGEPTEGEQSGSGEAQSATQAEVAQVIADIEAFVEELVEAAIAEASGEAEAEYNAMMEEIANFAPKQAFLCGDEENQSERIAKMLRSTLVESHRQKWQNVKHCGSLNSRRLVSAVTGGTYLRKRQITPHLPHIALLVDTSGSMMGNKIWEVSGAARVLNGAIAKVAAKSMVAEFNHSFRQLETVPLHGLSATGDTDTAYALRQAAAWLDKQCAKRGLILLCTDGQPNEPQKAAQAFAEVSHKGYYVLGVWIGGYRARSKFVHSTLICENIAKLPELLTEPLRQFVAGCY